MSEFPYLTQNTGFMGNQSFMMEQSTFTGEDHETNSYDDLLTFYNTFDPLDELCTTELNFAQKSLSMPFASDYSAGSSTSLVDARTLQFGTQTPLHMPELIDLTDGPELIDLTGAECNNDQCSDPNETFIEHDSTEPAGDSEDELLTVHFGESNAGHSGAKDNDKKHVCQICYNSFKYLYQLNRHEVTHSNVRPYECLYCSYAAKDKRGLTRHMLTHTNDRPFKCQWCDYSSIRPSELKQHLQFHAVKSPNKCRHCSYSTDKQALLNFHYKNHHRQNNTEVASTSSEKPVFPLTKYYGCEQCHCVCDSLENLTIHLKKHADVTKYYACDICQEKFLQMPSLEEHVREHLDKKNYRCSVCQRSFSQSNHLQLHSRSHLIRVKHQSRPSDISTVKNNTDVSHRNKLNDTKSYPVRDFPRKTEAMHSQLQPKQKIHKKKSEMDSHPTLFKLHKRNSSKGGIQFLSQSSESNKANRNSSSIPHGNKHKRGVKQPLSSAQNKTNVATSRLQQKKRISSESHSFELPGKNAEMMKKLQVHKCPLCEYFGSSFKALKLHVESHKQKKTYADDQHHYASNSSQNLKAHFLKHSGSAVKFYKCKVCEYSCRAPVTLNRHVAKCHAAGRQKSKWGQERRNKKSDAQLHICDICAFSCDSLAMLQDHLSNHAEKPACSAKRILYRCVCCSFKSDDPELLKKHLMTCSKIIGLW